MSSRSPTSPLPEEVMGPLFPPDIARQLIRKTVSSGNIPVQTNQLKRIMEANLPESWAPVWHIILAARAIPNAPDVNGPSSARAIINLADGYGGTIDNLQFDVAMGQRLSIPAGTLTIDIDTRTQPVTGVADLPSGEFSVVASPGFAAVQSTLYFSSVVNALAAGGVATILAPNFVDCVRVFASDSTGALVNTPPYSIRTRGAGGGRQQLFVVQPASSAAGYNPPTWLEWPLRSDAVLLTNNDVAARDFTVMFRLKI